MWLRFPVSTVSFIDSLFECPFDLNTDGHFFIRSIVFADKFFKSHHFPQGNDKQKYDKWQQYQ